jgi:hypothetical protein
MLRLKYEELEAILRDDGDGMAILHDQAAEFFDSVMVKLVEGVKIGDLLVVEKGGCCPLPKVKDSPEHRDGVVTNVFIEVVVLFKGWVLVVVFVLFIAEEIDLVVIVNVVHRRWWGFLGILRVARLAPVSLVCAIRMMR